MPLSAVVIISMIKDAFEDYKRYVSDKDENEDKILLTGVITDYFTAEKMEGVSIKLTENGVYKNDASSFFWNLRLHLKQLTARLVYPRLAGS